MLNLKILRLTAWLLLLVTLLSLFTGFVALKPYLANWFASSLAFDLHIRLIGYLFILLFYLHSLTGILNILSRHKKFNNKNIKLIIGILWTLIIILFVYFIMAAPPMIQGSNNYTVADVAAHNKSTDCWMIINSKVYDLTSYLSIHLGNAKTILPYCGKDGSGAYATKGTVNQPHSAYADSLLSAYLLGNLTN